MVIAVDAAGGDYAPQEIIKGAIKAAKEHHLQIILVGRKLTIEKLARRHARNTDIDIVNAEQVISGNESSAQAVRSKPNSSIVVGTRLVRDGKASVFVSAGSTGAVMSAAFLNLKRIPGVNRPAICTLIQINPSRPVLLVDSGANADCQPEMLVQFAKMASIFAYRVLGNEAPCVGLLNNGSEAKKGNLLARESYQLLKQSGLNFIGNIEGHEILSGKADVLVTDGFTGNLVLKTMEGMGDAFGGLLTQGQSRAVDRYIQGLALTSYTKLLTLARRANYTESGGAYLLGLQGNVVVVHGRSQGQAIKNSIYLASRLSNVDEYIRLGFNPEADIQPPETQP